MRSDPGNTYDLTAALSTAASRWNNALNDPRAGLHPTFSVVSPASGADVTVTANGGSANPTWCGHTPDSSHVVIDPNTGSHCPTNYSVVENTLTHELGHVLGFQSSTHSGSYTAGISTHCVMGLVDVAPQINPKPCEHEVEKVFAAYGMVPLSIVTDTGFYSHALVTGLNAYPSTLNLVKNQVDTVTVSQLLLTNGYTTSAARASA